MNEQILSIVESLQQTLTVKPVFDSCYAEKLFTEKRYATLISAIKKHMGITCHLRFKVISKELNDLELMRIYLPAIFPLYGTKRYEELSLDIFYHQKALSNFRVFVLGVSHELAHIVLHSLNHHLKTSEKATDITAIMLGFSHFFELGHTSIEKDFITKNITQRGYLSFEELITVLNIIDP